MLQWTLINNNQICPQTCQHRISTAYLQNVDHGVGYVGYLVKILFIWSMIRPMKKKTEFEAEPSGFLNFGQLSLVSYKIYLIKKCVLLSRWK